MSTGFIVFTIILFGFLCVAAVRSLYDNIKERRTRRDTEIET